MRAGTILIVLFIMAGCVDGQKNEGNDTQTNSEGKAQQAFKQKYADVQNVKWNVDDNGYQEAEFERDGTKYRADFTKDGEWIETEQSVEYEELPDAVKATIEKQASKNDITEIEFVESSKDGKFYDVEFKQKGKNKDIMITENGKIIRTE